MSSSGLIYAFIVGAWAVYLVPMWLRREDELNKARQTQRYTTAIKVLSHKESFERRYGPAKDQGAQESALPAAVGQGAAPEAGRETLERVRAKEREQGRGAAGAGVAAAGAGAAESAAGPAKSGPAKSGGAKSGGAGSAAAGSRTAGQGARGAQPGQKAVAATSPANRRLAVHASVAAQANGPAAAPSAGAGASVPATTPSAGATSPMLRARRRRVVGVLFAAASLGAIVSMDLGLRFIWVMLIPAAVLSAYIVWVRKDERARAAERARRHAMAVRAAREIQRREREERERGEREQQERDLLEREEQARREAAARRRAAAARSRAERRVVPAPIASTANPAAAAAPARPAPDPRDLPRAANG